MSTRVVVSTSITGQPPATGWVTSSFQSSSIVRSASKWPSARVPARRA
jgi:hypothetical protein